MGVTSCATLPFLPGTHVFSTVFKLLQANSTLFKHLWLVTLDHLKLDQVVIHGTDDHQGFPEEEGMRLVLIVAEAGLYFLIHIHQCHVLDAEGRGTFPEVKLGIEYRGKKIVDVFGTYKFIHSKRGIGPPLFLLCANC